MSEATSARRYPRWARVLGWLCMVVMGVACLGFIGFRLLVWQVRNKVEGVIAGAVTPEVLSRNSTPSSTTHASSAQTGLAATAIPHLGPVFSGDATANFAFATTVETLRRFLNDCGQIPEQGPIDFQALLISLGVELPAGTTNAEAAALFLARASAFAAFLAEWEAAVSVGSWDTSKTTGMLTYVSTAFSVIPRLLRLMAEAHWQAGDPAAAWESVVLLSRTSERAFDVARLHSQSAGYASSGLVAQTLAGGLAAGVWSDDQLRAIPEMSRSLDPLGNLPGYVEGTKRTLDLWAEWIGKGAEHSTFQLESTDVLGSMISMAHGVLDVSPQRTFDNYALIEAGLNADAASFNFETRTLLPAADRTELDPVKRLSDDWFASLYFAPAWGLRDFENEAPVGKVVAAQSQLDLSVIAAHLELEKRAKGSYPERLPTGVPHDVATGQSYRYERTEGGGYRLWGLGMDQSDQGGDPRNDIVWPAGGAGSP